ncbi:unnamed protein product [Chironomus riparius]|uniref:Uncharacterized protein n=1 Tax=Chironomus riparius TaxID=315576 RepID=A0A9N9WXY2_9DIPT|nr:unnamed protein product [Chironomus riparius]
MDQRGNQNQQKPSIAPQASFNESALSNFPSSSSSYQQFEASVSRNSTFVSSKLSLGLIIEKYKNHNDKINTATQNVRRSYNDRKKKFEKILSMYERQHEKSKQNLDLYRERSALCIDEMKRLESIIRGLNDRLYQIEGSDTENEEDWGRAQIEE